MQPNLHRPLLAACLSLACSGASAITVLGQPLGERMPVAIRLCPPSDDQGKTVCWIGPPYVAKDGSRLGAVRLPGPNSRPAWAAYALFRAHLAKDGTLLRLSVESSESIDRKDIVTSISSRFGAPSDSALGPIEGAAATWAQKEVHIRMLCSRERCTTTFSSPQAKAEDEREQARRRATELGRPVAP